MAKKVASIKHTGDARAHIPSKEEAGYEDANEKVSSGKKVLELPKNPVVHRGQDPELFWLNKYGNDDRDELLLVDIRSLYRHEHIAPETLIKNLYTVTETKSAQLDLFSSVNELFGNALDKDEIDKVSEYYHHQDGWTNRLIQGDSHLVMASLLEWEGKTKQKVEKTLKIEIDDEAFDRLYGHISHPIEIKKKGQKIAVRIISQFGEECTKVLTAG